MKIHPRRLGRPKTLNNHTIFHLVIERQMLVEIERQAAAANLSKSAFVRRIIDQNFTYGASNERV